MNMNEKIKWIFFDVGSTLVDESMVYQSRFEKIAESANVSKDYVFQKTIEYYKDNKKGDLKVANHLGVELPKWEHQYEILYKDTETCLKTLSQEYKIGIIANQDFGTEKRLKNFGIMQYIDIIIASAEEGVAKPDIRIFEIALKRAGCKPEQSVMVGDRIDNDIVPAKKVGMRTIQIKQGMGKYQKVQNERESPDFSVDNLSELLDMFI